MEITASLVKKLRDETGAGMMDCKKALVEAEGDLEKAKEILRKKGIDAASKKAGRATSNGRIESYIHMEGKIGVLIEVGCETDFVARTDDFKQLAKNLAMQIAAMKPVYVSRDSVPQDVIEKEKEIYKAQIPPDKPEQVIERILEGKLEKFFEENCLLEQVYIRDEEGKIKVKDYISETIAKLGENIVVKRFTRYELGEESE